VATEAFGTGAGADSGSDAIGASSTGRWGRAVCVCVYVEGGGSELDVVGMGC
jgi:hypothetical protein